MGFEFFVAPLDMAHPYKQLHLKMAYRISE